MTERIGADNTLANLEQSRLLRVTPEREDRAAAGKADTKAAGDRVEISAQAVQMVRAREAVEGASESRQDLVNRLRQEVENGTYAVDTQDVAKRMLSLFGPG